MADNRIVPPKKEEEREDWLLSYADMITLLLAFFALLLSMSKIDPVKYEQVQGGMAKDIGKREGATPIDQLKNEMSELLSGLKIDESKISLGTDDRGIMLEFDAGTLFDPGSAKLKPAMLGALDKMAAMLDGPRYSAFQVEVDGNTDDRPFSSPEYASNWELSAARASAVVRYFIAKGMAPMRLSAIGYADTRPKVSNRDAAGNPLPQNEAINNRVTVHVTPR